MSHYEDLLGSFKKSFQGLYEVKQDDDMSKVRQLMDRGDELEKTFVQYQVELLMAQQVMAQNSEHSCTHMEHIAHEVVTLEGILEGIKIERS